MRVKDCQIDTSICRFMMCSAYLRCQILMDYNILFHTLFMEVLWLVFCSDLTKISAKFNYLPYLTRLTLLIHISVLPSNWNLGKNFALSGPLGQVHMVKKNFWNSSMRKPFSCNSFYLLVLRKITNSVTKTTIFPHGGKSEIFFLPYSDTSIKNTVLRPNRQYKASTAEVAEYRYS